MPSAHYEIMLYPWMVRVSGRFAAFDSRCRKPLWGQAILRKHIRPGAQSLGDSEAIRTAYILPHIFDLLRSVGRRGMSNAIN